MRIITCLFYLFLYSVSLVSCTGKIDVNNKNTLFANVDTNKNIVLYIIPKGECVSCKTLVFSKSYEQLKKQYPVQNIFFLFDGIRSKEALHFLKFNVKDYNADNILIDEKMFHMLWKQLKTKQASILVINKKQEILLQRPVKEKIIKDYDFSIK